MQSSHDRCTIEEISVQISDIYLAINTLNDFTKLYLEIEKKYFVTKTTNVTYLPQRSP